MSADERSGSDPVVVRLREYTPPPGFDAHAALAAGRRSVSRRRRAAAVTLTALVAVAGAAAVTVGRAPDAPDTRPADASGPATSSDASSAPPPDPVAAGTMPSAPPSVTPSTSLSVAPSRPLSRVGTLACVATRFEAATDSRAVEVFGVSPDGRFVVGATRPGDGADRPTVWRDGRVEASGPGPQWIVVNRSGVAAGYSVSGGDVHRAAAYVRRDGQVRELPTPAGYQAAIPMAVTDAGDVFGTLRRGDMVFGDGPSRGGYNFHDDGRARDLDLVLWPSASPGSPRVIPDPGDATVVGVAGADLMFADVRVGTSAARPYAWSTTLAGGPVTLPAGWTAFDVRVAVGGHLYGVTTSSGTPPGTGTLVRWNVSTGRVETFTGGSAVVAGNGAGWFAASVPPGAGGHLLVAPDGTARTFAAGTPHWIGPDGATVIGTDHGTEPVRWQCR